MSTLPVAVSTWSFHDPIFAGRLTAGEALAEAAALGFTAVEINDLFAVAPRPPLWLRAARRVHRTVVARLPWKPPIPGLVRRPRRYRPAVVAELARAARQAGVQVVSWGIDTDLTAVGRGVAAQRGYWKRALETAQALGAEVVRLTTGGPASAPDTRAGPILERARAALCELTDLGERAGLVLAVENHWGLSAEPARLAALIEGVGAPAGRLGVCLDFGNFPPGCELAGIEALAPLATHVHAKSYSFGPDGEEERLPYGPILRALRAADYRGWLVIEYEGTGNAISGIGATRALIERHWPGAPLSSS